MIVMNLNKRINSGIFITKSSCNITKPSCVCMVKRILVIGGTKYLGLEFIRLLDRKNKELFVASRKEIQVENFIKIDRKSQKDLDKLFSDNHFDIVIDFINYSGSDSQILLNSFKLQKTDPKLILISTVYTYCMPLELEADSMYNESSFNPSEYFYSLIDRPDVSYTKGKRDMESYCIKNYRNDKLVILRFPIILGATDYTRRTHFYIEQIKNNIQINPKNIGSKSPYIFSLEAAKAIFNFVNNDFCGIYNVVHDVVAEIDLIKMFCNHYGYEIDMLLSSDVDPTITPFSSNFDFIVDGSKYSSMFPINLEFEKSLHIELLKITG